MKNILVIGATSAIAVAAAREWAKRGCRFHLLARDSDKLTTVVDDLRVRGAAQVSQAVFQAEEFAAHGALIDGAVEALSSIDIVLLAHGTLSDQQACQADFPLAQREINNNAISYFALLELLADYMEQRRQGSIAVISSVAGDRGRQSNYIYGAAKGAVSLYVQGLRQRLHKSGVHVLTVKPGFVDTPMTREFKKGLLWAQPDAVAKTIVAAVDKRRDVLYTPWFWRYIMLIIKLIPEAVFKRLSL